VHRVLAQRALGRDRRARRDHRLAGLAAPRRGSGRAATAAARRRRARPRPAHAGLVLVQQRVVARQAAALGQAASSRASRSTSRRFGTKPAQSLAGRCCARHARSGCWPGSWPPPAPAAARWRCARRGASRAGWPAPCRPAARRGRRPAGGQVPGRWPARAAGRPSRPAPGRAPRCRGRHEGGLVPVRDGLQVAQPVQAQLAAGEVVVGGGGAHESQSGGISHSSAAV
jgi:hypothetical protein